MACDRGPRSLQFGFLNRVVRVLGGTTTAQPGYQSALRCGHSEARSLYSAGLRLERSPMGRRAAVGVPGDYVLG